jgi:hypothetical protein
LIRRKPHYHFAKKLRLAAFEFGAGIPIDFIHFNAVPNPLLGPAASCLAKARRNISLIYRTRRLQKIQGGSHFSREFRHLLRLAPRPASAPPDAPSPRAPVLLRPCALSMLHRRVPRHCSARMLHRRTGALVALAASSVLVVQLVSSVVVVESKHVMGPYIVFLFGCATCRRRALAAGGGDHSKGLSDLQLRLLTTWNGGIRARALPLSIEKLKHAVLFVYTIFLLCFICSTGTRVRQLVQELNEHGISALPPARRNAGASGLHLCAAHSRRKNRGVIHSHVDGA